MILTLMRDLRSNGFLLPAFTSYNLSDIPFAYPPLGVYLGGFLGTVGIPELEVLRWLPLLANLASIPVFYLLARAFLRDDPRAAVAALVFSLVPGNYAWQIMGGGMTRSFGVLFYLLANYFVYHLLHVRSWKFVSSSALFCALAVLSHPEAALATAASCAFFWLSFGRSRDGTLKSALVALGTLLLTAPWWGSVIAVHGLGPFTTVFHSGDYWVDPFKSLLLGLLSPDPWTGLFPTPLPPGAYLEYLPQAIFPSPLASPDLFRGTAQCCCLCLYPGIDARSTSAGGWIARGTPMAPPEPG